MLVKKLTFSFSVQLSMLLVSMATSIFVARLAGPMVLGTFSSALAIVSLVGLLGDMGLNNAHLRIYPGSDEPAKAIGVFVALKASLITVMMLVLVVYIYVVETSETGGQEYLLILLVCAASAVLSQVATIGVSTFSARVERRKAELPRIANTLVASVLKLTVAAAGFGALALAYSELAGAVVLVLVVMYLWRGTKIARPNMTLAKEYLLCSLPLLFVSLSQGVVHNLDKVMIKYAYPGSTGFSEVGIYTAGSRLGAIILTLVSVVSIIFFPTFAALAKKNEIGRIRQILGKYENLVVYFLMPLCILLVVFSEPVILFLLGEKYRASAQVLQVTVIGFFIFSFNQPYINYFGAVTKKLHLIVAVYMIYVMSNIVLNLVFVPEHLFGFEVAGLKSYGAAIATTLSYILLGSMVRLLGNVRLGKSNTLKRYRVEFLIMGALTMLTGYGYTKLDSISIPGVMAVSAIYILLYFSLSRMLCPQNSKMAFESAGKIHPRLRF